MRLRSVIAALVAALETSGPDVAGRLHHLALQLDATIGLDAGLPPEPLLWRNGGKPVLPPSLESVHAGGRLAEVCRSLRAVPSGRSCAPSPVIASAVARALEEASAESMEEDRIVDRDEAGAVVGAMLATDIDLRRKVLEGTCLFQAGMHVKHGGHVDLAAVLNGTLQAFQERLTRAAALAVTAAGSVLGRDELANASGTMPEGISFALSPREMVTPTARSMQGQLASWADLNCSSLQLAALVGAESPGVGVLSILTAGDTLGLVPGPLQALLAQVEEAVVASGCRDVAEGVPYHLLGWLMDALAHGLDPVSADWRQEMLQSVAHEAWYKWHKGLWDGPASQTSDFLSTYHGADTSWQALGGPLRLHLCTLSVLAGPFTVGATVHLKDRQQHMLKLQIASRHVRNACSMRSGGLEHARVALAEWRAAALVAASVIAAHTAVVQPADQEDLAAVVMSLKTASMPANLYSGLTATVAGSIARCSHAKLREVMPPLLLPALEALLLPNSISVEADGELFSTFKPQYPYQLRLFSAHKEGFSPFQGWRCEVECGRCWVSPDSTCACPQPAPIPLPSMPCCGGTPSTF